MCQANGPREPFNDKPCNAIVQPGWSGFCECAGGGRVGLDCGHRPSDCDRICAAGAWR
jgi:hypothetical protein